MDGDDQLEQSIAAVARLLAGAQRILVITGAGVSADSGLPTYRGIGGLYNDGDTDDGMPIEMALSAEVFAENPALTWKYIAQIESACRGAQHNPAHAAIAALEAGRERVCVLTQNVDGFHTDAGSTDVIEMHGNLRYLHCVDCRHAEIVRDYAELDIPPSCRWCGHFMRPRVVLFGEMLPTSAVTAYEAAMQADFDLVISVGTTAVFPYIAAPLVEAARRGVPTVEINPGTSEISTVVRHHLPFGAAEAFRRLAASMA